MVRVVVLRFSTRYGGVSGSFFELFRVVLLFCVRFALALELRCLCTVAVAGCASRDRSEMRHSLCLVAWALLPCYSVAFVPGGATASLFRHQQSSLSERPRIRQRSHADGLLWHARRMRSATMQSEMADAGVAETEAVEDKRKKVVVIGAGWAGLAAAYELSKQVR